MLYGKLDIKDVPSIEVECAAATTASIRNEEPISEINHLCKMIVKIY